MASSSNADACYSLNGKLLYDLQWGVMGVRNQSHVPIIPTEYRWPGKWALLPDFCTVAHMWAPSSFSSYFSVFWFMGSPPSQWRKMYKNISVQAITTSQRKGKSAPIHSNFGSQCSHNQTYETALGAILV